MDNHTQRSAFSFVMATMLMAAAATVAMALLTGKARAADPWSGCGTNLHGSLMSVGSDIGPGFFIGARGETIGASVLCDVQMDKVVVGGFVEYDRPMGTLWDLGLRSDITVGGRLGYLPQPTTLLYAHAGRAWWETDGAGTFEGWKIGVGSELRLPTTAPLFLDVRYTRAYVEDTGAPSNVTGDSVRLGLTFKFGAGIGSLAKTAPLK